MIREKFVVHNYGHGGAGISMSWGCADVVAKIVRGYASPSEQKSIAILGAGVMGLTAATLLSPDYKVTIYAERLTCTTSDIAGGQWAPSVIKYDERDPAAKARFEDILRTAYRMHEQRIGRGFGVSIRINYTKAKSDTFAKVPPDLIAKPTWFEPLPFKHMASNGWGYRTLLVEPPVFLPRLRNDLVKQGVQSVQKLFKNVAQLAELSETIVINCTGLGSKTLFADNQLQPIKGHLVLLPAQPSLTWLFSNGSTYVFPREDHVVVGGSYEENMNDEIPDPKRCQDIMRIAKDVFAGRALAKEFEDAPWLLRNK
ncbi:FAD-dependent oxidoreductase [Rhizobium sp. FKY42]|uniref:FAD-dependent oxidoreductase n=1 Tax=Rhizobium sp. FKY42 TaxID=2562310 RepID=UPI0014855BE2|nr:FAD-dependent oxidoreductase [Rhizobium sp. FKY42]